MSERTAIVSVRLPSEIVDKIDESIENYGHYTTKPSFIVHSMETLFRQFVRDRIELDNTLDKMKEVTGELDSSTVTDIIRKTLSKYMEKYQNYGGDNVQILLRVPKKMLSDLEEYASILGYYSEVQDFIRMAVISQLDADAGFREQMERVYSHNVKQLKNSEEIVKSLMEDLSSNSDGLLKITEMFQNALTKTFKDE